MTRVLSVVGRGWSKLQHLDPRLLDGLLAVGLSVAAGTQLLAEEPVNIRRLLPVIGTCLPLVLRRRYPLVCHAVDARGLKAYDGAAPVRRASGKKLVVLHRKVKNQRLAAVGYLWTFAALRLSPGARAHYDRRRVAGDRHAAAQRHLFNRFLSCLFYCLQTGQPYAEDLAFPSILTVAA